MRMSSVLLALGSVALGVAACGGSGSSSTTRGSGAVGGGIPGPVKIYRLKLSGAAESSRGAPAGTGDAIIAFHGTSEVCWRFAHLHGFSDATSAHLHSGPNGKAGKVVVTLSRGPRLHHQGCRHLSPAVISAIERRPQDYYLNIHSVQFPHGAVRAQL
jgi:hypothetical protein